MGPGVVRGASDRAVGRSWRPHSAAAIGLLAVSVGGPAPLGCSKVRRDDAGRTIVQVLSHPPGARVTASNGAETTTPGEIAVEREKRVVLTFALDGYEPQTVTSLPTGVQAFDRLGHGNFGGVDLLNVFRASAQDEQHVMVPNPVGVDLVPVGGTLARFPRAAGRIPVRAARCRAPMDVREDCSGWSGPKQMLVVRGLPVRVSGSDASRSVLVLLARPEEIDVVRRPREHGRDACVRVIRAAVELGADLLDAIEVVAGAQRTIGCYLRFSRPVYAPLKAAWPAAEASD